MYPPPSATPLQRLCANFVRAGRRVKAVHSSLHPGGGNAGCRPGLLHAGPALQVLQRLTPATAEKDPPRAPKALYRVFPIYISPSSLLLAYNSLLHGYHPSFRLLQTNRLLQTGCTSGTCTRLYRFTPLKEEEPPRWHLRANPGAICSSHILNLCPKRCPGSFFSSSWRSPPEPTPICAPTLRPSPARHRAVGDEESNSSLACGTMSCRVSLHPGTPSCGKMYRPSLACAG